MLQLLICCLLTLAPGADKDEPVTWLTDLDVEVGDIPYGEDYTHVFRFRNETDAPLSIDNVRVGCGCTDTTWEEEAIPPDSLGSINVTYDAMNAGYFRKYAKVYFVGHRGGHKLWLTGFVE